MPLPAMSSSMMPHQPAEPLPDNTGGFFLVDPVPVAVRTGSVQLFIGEFDRKSGEPLRSLLPIATIDAGQWLFPMPQVLDNGTGICRTLAVPLPGSELTVASVDSGAIDMTDALTCARFEAFLAALLSGFAHDMPPPQTIVVTASDLAQGTVTDISHGASLRPASGILWLSLQDGFAMLNGDEEQLLLIPGSVFPLSPMVWVQAMDPLRIACRTTSEVFSSGRFEEVCAAFMDQLLRAAMVAVTYRNADQVARREQLRAAEAKAVADARIHLRNIANGRPVAALALETGSDSSARAREVIGWVCAECGIRLNANDLSTAVVHSDDTVDLPAMLERLQLYHRRIRLTGNWWRGAAEPLIGRDATSGEAVALLPRNGRYWMRRAGAAKAHPVSAAMAATIDGSAWTIYANLPNRPVGGWDILRLAGHGLRKDWQALLLIGLLAGLIALVPTRMLSNFYDAIIPTGDRLQLLQFGLILFTAACAASLFEWSRGLIALRIKSRANYRLQAGVWSRLMDLPLSFFRQYASGDLAQRVMGIDAIRSMLADYVTTAALALLFAVPNLLLMAYFSAPLTAVACAALLLWFLLLAGISTLNYANLRREFHADGELSGFSLQAISGISKIRLSGAEERAFIRWVERFSEKLLHKRKAIANYDAIALINGVFPALMSGLFFWLVGGTELRMDLTTGDFLAFTAAFTILATAVAGFAMVVPSVLASAALYQRLQPVLTAVPERTEAQQPVHAIDGRVEMRNVSFRYHPDQPRVLDQVSLHAEPGDFIAIVGPSGAGKSTIVRLLLGFDDPESGGIYFGNFDVAKVNRRDLRKQIGTVLQAGGLLQGSIYQNIAGASGLSMEQAWQAARMAGCAADIEAMPMGMHTVVFDGAISGGQRQRILIARALARNPRLLIFDEATSALDNETQAHVADSLQRLNATRIIIAHRLSTIINAHRIYVLDAGRIVASGTYSELMAANGLFARLAKRQLG